MGKKTILYAALGLIVGAAIFFAAQQQQQRGGRRATRPGFIGARGAHFTLDGQPFRFVGANVAVMYRDDDRARLPETMREAARQGLRVVRVWAHGEGGEDSDVKSIGGDRADWPRNHPFRFTPERWNEEQFVHLDRVIAEAARNNIRVQLTLVNWWRDTGGVTQYLRWAGIKDAADDSKPYGINVERAMLFYTNDVTRRMYREHVERIVTRRNTVTGTLYAEDPTIMGYELMNEAQAVTGRWAERRAWVAEMSAYIKTLDPDHLVTPGTWGYRTSWERREWLEEHRIPTIDYCDVHNYPRDDHDSYVESPAALGEFIANRAAASFALRKPLMFGEFGMGPDGYKGFTEAEWYRAFLEGTARAGVGGAVYWILTPDAQRGYGVTYTTPRDEGVRAEIRRGADLMASLEKQSPPRWLEDADQHLIPRQFAFERPATDPALRPEMEARSDGAFLYRFKPEMAASARFEKLGGGEGYIWGYGMGFVEYLIPAREKYRRVGRIIVRAHIQPVLPVDARPSDIQTRVTLLINGTDCGSRLVPVEDPRHAVTQEWSVDSYRVRLQAARGLQLNIRFAVQTDADKPYGLNISNYPAGYSDHEVRPIEIEVR
ncbi:MAG TPA: cellulase family glycosylhydrolase [Pyrinomonadaceae bacterium]|jgi:mannan endo-1,4-beta-mannosidase|nr:cellulase family glycosylhydrolase [Pyrinomonadaceae bacterium]